MAGLLRIGLFCLLALSWPVHGAVQDLESAEFVLSDAQTPPGNAVPWQVQKLPDAWSINHPQARFQSGGWYRLRFHTAPGQSELRAVYLPKLGLNAEVYVNDQPIGNGGPFHEPFGRNWNRPLLFVIPPGVVHGGENWLQIRLLSHPYTQASLHPPQVGPEALLRPVFDRAHFLRITINQTASLLILAIGILMLTLWWQRRQDVAYGYFGLSALVWAAQSTNLYLQQAPLDTAAWEILINSSFQVFSGLLLISLLRFSAAGGRPLEPLLWGAMAASPISLWLTPAQYFLDITAAWHVFTLACTAATLGFLLRAALKWRNRDAALMAGAISIVIVLAGHDWLMHSQHLWLHAPREYPDDLYLLHYSAPLIFMAVGLIMTGRFVKVLNEFEALNNDLENRVRSKHEQLQESYARMRALETEQAVTEERERIYRDLHDDVGAKLLSLVYRAEHPDNANLARSALQDLRDVVSTTQQDNLSLAALCADWRAECEQRLAEAKITLDWVQPEFRDELQLTQPQAINLGRILRESVSNLIKHANARHAQVRIDAQGQLLKLSVRDEGIGRQEAAVAGSGRGLRNMVARAERIGATCLFTSPETAGYEVSVTLPLSAHLARLSTP